MAVVAHTEQDVNILARLMRAEAEGDGKLGMLMVGNTGINKHLARKTVKGLRYHLASCAVFF